MQYQIDQMMRSWFHTENLAIQHVRHGREWVPVVRMNVSESPHHVVPVQPCLNSRIAGHVSQIIEIDEPVAQGPPENGEGDGDESGADRDLQNGLGAHDSMELSCCEPERKQDVDLTAFHS